MLTVNPLLLVELLAISVMNLSNVIKPRERDGKQDSVRLILCFDEAHELSDASKASPSGARWSLFTALRSAFIDLKAYAFFAVFLSTNSSVNYFSAPSHIDPSYRFRNQHLIPGRCFTAFSFDRFAPQHEVGTSLEAISQMSNICLYGRHL